MYSIDELQQKVTSSFSETALAKEPAALYEPIVYSLNLGGKRIRPLLVLLACDLFGGDVEKALPAATGIELFHNFTLLHDDIMDRAPLRRGKETVFKKWNTDTAILSGDTMFILACQYLARTGEEKLAEILQVFNKTALEVCEGQQYDMIYEKQENVSIEDYLGMIRLKTAVLLGCSLKTGAIIAGASPADTEKIFYFGENLGMAFQLQDDLLDAFGDESKFGKETGGDIVSGKKTFLYLKALELSDAGQKIRLATDYSASFRYPKKKIEGFKKIFSALKIQDETSKLISHYVNKARAFLNEIEVDAERKKELFKMVNTILCREY